MSVINWPLTTAVSSKSEIRSLHWSSLAPIYSIMFSVSWILFGTFFCTLVLFYAENLCFASLFFLAVLFISVFFRLWSFLYVIGYMFFKFAKHLIKLFYFYWYPFRSICCVAYDILPVVALYWFGGGCEFLEAFYYLAFSCFCFSLFVCAGICKFFGPGVHFRGASHSVIYDCLGNTDLGTGRKPIARHYYVTSIEK